MFHHAVQNKDSIKIYYVHVEFALAKRAAFGIEG